MMVELGEEDAACIRGGSPDPVTVSAMLVGAFAAGFRFGYYDLAPRLFD